MTVGQLNSEIISLKRFAEIHGADPKNWENRPCCPECGVKLIHYDIRGAFGVRNSKTRRLPGWSHPGGTASKCPGAKIVSKEYDHLEHYKLDARIKDEVLGALSNPDVLKTNRRVCAYMWRAATLEPLTQTTANLFSQVVVDRELDRMEGLIGHPWAFPFVLLSVMGPIERYNGTKIEFSAKGQQRLPYIQKTTGREMALVVPQMLAPHVLKGEARWPVREKGQDVTFVVSQESAFHFSRLETGRVGTMRRTSHLPVIWPMRQVSAQQQLLFGS